MTPAPTPGTATAADPLVLLAATALYARQSRLIDTGDAAGWAATFTPDGIFDSPSYEHPVARHAELARFAAAYAQNARETGVVSRHVVTNVDVVETDGRQATVLAYLQIVATPRGSDSRLVRLTTIEDRLLRTPGGVGWVVAHRQVRRDDAGPETALPSGG